MDNASHNFQTMENRQLISYGLDQLKLFLIDIKNYLTNKIIHNSENYTQLFISNINNLVV